MSQQLDETGRRNQCVGRDGGGCAAWFDRRCSVSYPVCQRWRSTTKPQLLFPLQALSSPLGILWFCSTFTLLTIYQNTFRAHSLPWTLLGIILQVGVR